MKIKLAVISDLHVGKAARAKDLCPSPHNAGMIDDTYQQKFCDFVRANELQADYLLLPGDITDSAQPDEVQIASEFIATATKALGVAPERVFFVPGNHDADWSVLQQDDSTGLRWKQRYDPLRHDAFNIKDIMTNGSGDLLEEPHFSVAVSDNLLVAAYNSAHKDNPNAEHYGLADHDDLEQLKEKLAELPFTDQQVRAFLVHHHPMQYSDPDPDRPDFSVMVNAEELLDVLRQFRFDLLIHGHKHSPRFKTHSVEGAAPIAILCSGSFSIKIDSRWAGVVNNQFHMVEIDGRGSDEEKMIQGRVKSWTYTYARSWTPSQKEHSGIPHIEPFGSYIMPGRLEGLLGPVIEGKLKDSQYIEWSSIVATLPEMEHLRPEVIIRALDVLSPSLGFRRLRDVPSEIVILKKLTI